jgi:hypothetical protein
MDTILFLSNTRCLPHTDPSRPDSNEADSFEYLFYGLAVASIINILVLYIPISILYRKRMKRRQQEGDEESTNDAS